MPGAIRLQTVIDVCRENGVALPTHDPEELRPYVQVVPGTPRNLSHLLSTISVFLSRCFPNREAVARIAYEAVEDAFREGIRYLELRFAPFPVVEANSISVADLMAGVAEGLRLALSRYPIQVGLLIGVSRHYGPEGCRKAVDLALQYAGSGVVGVDMSGDEEKAPARLFAEDFKRLAGSGLGITIHAGEAAGAWSVRDAVELLGAHRIGHGVRSVEDPAVVALLGERGVTLEMCPISNWWTGATPSYDVYPLRALHEAGVPVTINTDDPLWFNCTLLQEYELALTQLGVTPHALGEMILNGARGAFLPPTERTKLEGDLRESIQTVLAAVSTN